MLFDAIVALFLMKVFDIEAVYALVAVGMVTLMRTCHNINSIIGMMYVEELEENEEEN